MSDFKPITTQAELDEVLKDRIKRAKETGRKEERKKTRRALLIAIDYLGKVARGLDDK